MQFAGTRCGLVFIGSIMLLMSASVSANATLNVVTSLSQSDPMYEGLVAFKALVEKRSQKQITIRIFIGSQLGNDNDMLEQAMLGANVAVLADAGRLAVYQNELGILGAPYLVEDYQQLNVLTDSELFYRWSKALAKNSGLHILSFNWWQGSRHLLTQRSVSSPSDLQGIRMRTIGAPVWIDTINAMGATPTPLAWSEVYSGLQQNVIDAAEAQLTGLYGARLYEVISHVTKTGHIQLLSGLVGSQKWFSALTNDEQEILYDAAYEAGIIASARVRETEAQIEAALISQGVSVDEVDITLFTEATNKVYSRLGYTQLRAEVSALLKRAGNDPVQ
ncbi:C4-dicarboxylate TRAP transporter substrate-binding protein [Alteromonas confluentis]|nr:C4-dicarboxylate TRAP transporter substrate-binding protein [Alteromonas confluentis]